jgi:hypothetical protein
VVVVRQLLAALLMLAVAVGAGLAAVAMSPEGAPVAAWLVDVTNRDPAPVTADVAPVARPTRGGPRVHETDRAGP